jgi:hypothetical protein
MLKSDELKKIEIAIYALGTLGGAQRSVHSEDIAMKCHELAPSLFSWRLEKYRHLPDKVITKSALENAKKPDGEGLVEGIYGGEPTKDGWRLTRRGVQWFRENCSRIESQLDSPAPDMPREDAKRFVKHVRGLPAFKQFQRAKTVPDTIYLLADMLSCSPDAAIQTLALKFRRLTTMAELVHDDEITAFLEACAKTFPNISSVAHESRRGDTK